MARLVPTLTLIPTNIITCNYIIITIIATLSIISLVMYLCASHDSQKEVASTMKRKLTTSKKHLLSSFNHANNASYKALSKMILCRKSVSHNQHDYNEINHSNVDKNVEDGYEEEEAVWKKRIIKGGKCRPLNFPGIIEYDYDGNLTPLHKPNYDDNVISSNKHMSLSPNQIQ
ncbi:hypothetical protein RND81_03G180300 [Saponaria officinalis]|uniref:Uncharacterized protein n=1 Tax=Saponaria officinalis TaxID=3572 RepID=A0AAW1MBL0_SAPOF